MYLDYLKKQNAKTFTENGAVALNTTGNDLLDAFAKLPTMMKADEKDIITCFAKAFYDTDPNAKRNAMRLLFYVRDIRGGQGARRPFRVCMRWLSQNHPDYVIRNIPNILEFGRGDDLLALIDCGNKTIKDAVLGHIATTLLGDATKLFRYTILLDKAKQFGMKAPEKPQISLMAKWAPSENSTTNPDKRRYAKLIRNRLGMTPRTYRKTLVALREQIGVPEQKMSTKQWDDIDYNKVPGKASIIYSESFIRHDTERYTKYLRLLQDGQRKAKASALYPAEIIRRVYNNGRHDLWTTQQQGNYALLNSLWAALPNYGEGETGIAVCDVSNSMHEGDGMAFFVSVALGIYLAERAKGPFKNHFITFSDHPEILELKGDTLQAHMDALPGFLSNTTNLEAVFDLLLNTAVQHHCAQEELPSKLYIISDMQFDRANSKNRNKLLMEEMEEKFRNAGYTMPSIVYWNASSRNRPGIFQADFQKHNVAMVAGYSPALFDAVMNGTKIQTVVESDGTTKTKTTIDPMDVMMAAINNPRYDCIWSE